jgi:hypothetical protein
VPVTLATGGIDLNAYAVLAGDGTLRVIGHTRLLVLGLTAPSKCCPCCAAERLPSTGSGSERAPGKSDQLGLDSTAKTSDQCHAAQVPSGRPE